MSQCDGIMGGGDGQSHRSVAWPLMATQSGRFAQIQRYRPGALHPPTPRFGTGTPAMSSASSAVFALVRALYGLVDTHHMLVGILDVPGVLGLE